MDAISPFSRPRGGDRPTDPWLALVIGNSRLHWAAFVGDRLQATWHTPHLAAQMAPEPQIPDGLGLVWPSPQPLALWIASVVPQQTDRWRAYPQHRLLHKDEIPIQGMYANFGLDRALTLWGALVSVGSPVLVIDGGTALTLTAAVGQQLVGGAILPGLRLQQHSLHQGTAALPWADIHQELPPRWAMNTPDAIGSGIVYTVLAGLQDFIADWRRMHPHGRIVLTGGDGDRLCSWLQQRTLASMPTYQVDGDLLFRGLPYLGTALNPLE